MRRWRWSRSISAAGRRWSIKDRVKVRLVGDLQTELVEDFFGGFVNHAGANLHAKVLYGRSNHHKIEAIFKCFARAMRYACSTDQRLKDQLPSTKGLLDDLSIFDYGAGNLRSVQNTLGAIGADYELIRDAAGLRNAHRRSFCRASALWPDDARAGRADVRDALARKHPGGRTVSGNLSGIAGAVRHRAKKRRKSGAWGFSGQCQAFPGRCAHPAHGLESTGARARIAAAARISATSPTSISRTATMRR